jgi:hypothetical protein
MKCDCCSNNKIEFTINIRKTMRNNGQVYDSSQFWCLDCVRKEIEEDKK